MKYRYQNQSKTNPEPIEKQFKNNNKTGYKIYSYETNSVCHKDSKTQSNT